MPSRKPHFIEPGMNTSQSSMRRLSSIASLHQLLPFSRSRRSNPDSDPPSCGEEDSSCASNALTSSVSTNSSSTQYSEHGQQDCVPLRGTTSHRRGDYTTINDESTSKLPRSRTFSNLPLPMRSREKHLHRNRQPPRQQQLPSVAPVSTRLPTPTDSTRRYFPFGARSGNHLSSLTARTKLKRSDTEPLLTAELGRKSPAHRATAFKENLTPGNLPSTPAPPRTSAHISFADTSAHKQSLPRDKSFGGTIPRTPTKTWSDPVYAIDKTPTQSSYLAATAPVARHQNALGDITNSCYPGRGIDIHATTTPSVHQSKTPDTQSSRRSDALYRATAAAHAVRAVNDAQPTAYWSGRLSSVVDRYQREELAASLDALGTMATRSETDKLHAASASIARSRRALEELYSTCMTDDAKESLITFQLQYAALQNEPELARPVGSHIPRPKVCGACSEKPTKTASSELQSRSGGSGRKASFVDRLLGRSKRNSLV